MAAIDDVDELIEQYHLALDEIMKGSPEGYKKLYSRRDDVTLANPFGPPVRGWDEVAKTLERAASHYRDGEATGFENVAKYVSAELAYIVEVERGKSKVGGRDDITPLGVRVTSIFSARRGHLEGSAPTHGPHNHRSASRIGDTELDLRSQLSR